jgi:ribosome-associated protein
MRAAKYALEKKATELHVLDLTAITSMTDFFIVATGSSDRQVKAIAENVIAQMRESEGVGAWRSEGWESLQWVIIDFVDFVVHVFQPESRRYYNIERLWADAPMVEVSEEMADEAPKGQKKKASLPGTKIKVISDFKPVTTKPHK